MNDRYRSLIMEVVHTCGESIHNLRCRFASWLSTGEGRWAVALKYLIRLGCQNQRLTVYIVYSNFHLPIALNKQPAN